MSTSSIITSRLRRVGVVVTAALVGCVLAACGSSSSANANSTTPNGTVSSGSSADLSTVTLRVGDQEHLLQTLLTASGQLKGIPYHLQWNEFTSGPPMLAALSSGDLDLGSVGDTPPAFAAASNEAVRIVAAEAPGGDRNDAIVVPPGSKITSVAQLKGKRVAVAEGTSGNYALLRALTKAGLTWSDITPVYLQPPDALAALRSGSIDAWAVWYPFVALAKAQGARVLESGVDLDPGYGFIVSPPSTLADAARAAALGDFLHRLQLAQDWVDSHVQAWASSYAQLAGTPAAVALETAQVEGHDHYVPVSATVVAAEQQLADAFSAIGLIHPIQVSQIVDARYTQLLSQS